MPQGDSFIGIRSKCWVILEGDQKGKALNDLEGDGFVKRLHVATVLRTNFPGEQNLTLSSATVKPLLL